MILVRRAAPVVGWLAGLGGLVAGTRGLGHGALATPELTAPATWGAWLSGRTAPEAVMAVLRLTVLVVAAYLFVVTVLAVALRLGRAGRLVTILDVVTLPHVRPVVHAVLGLGLAGATFAGVAAHPAPMARPTSADDAIAVTSADGPEPEPVAVTLPEEAPAPAPAATPTWTVGPGDHLWSIAARVLATAWARPPADGEVGPYWEQLVAANRARLADPANPDLLFAGQVLAVPPVPPGG